MCSFLQNVGSTAVSMAQERGAISVGEYGPRGRRAAPGNGRGWGEDCAMAPKWHPPSPRVGWDIAYDTGIYCQADRLLQIVCV